MPLKRIIAAMVTDMNTHMDMVTDTDMVMDTTKRTTKKVASNLHLNPSLVKKEKRALALK